MSEELKITREKALEIYDNADAEKKVFLEQIFGKASFQKISMEKIKTIDDILEYHGLTLEQFDNSTIGFTKDEKSYKLLKMLSEALNQGWIPNWDNPNEDKYYPWFEMSSSGFRFGDYVLWRSNSTVGSRLCFKSRELAEYAGKQFIDIYENFMLIK